jgi:serine/threonine protein kinase
MTRIPGEPLEEFFASKPCLSHQPELALERAVGLASQLLKQVGKSLGRINERVWHRDVNPRNVLISDAVSGKSFDAMKGDSESVRFGLIDFGRAVDSRNWSTKWATSSIAGDCRYWPASSWLMSFHGSQALKMEPSLLNQYQHHLDSYALGVLALEMLCGSLKNGSTSSLDATWQRLLQAFAAFHPDMHGWNREVNAVFSIGGNPHCLRQKYQREGVAMKVRQHAAALVQCLQACALSSKKERINTLLRVVSELLNEHSRVSCHDAAGMMTGRVPLPAQSGALPASKFLMSRQCSTTHLPRATWVSPVPFACDQRILSSFR